MKPQLTLYSRRECCLCDEMKAVLREVGLTTMFDLEEIDIDSDAELQARFNDQVPLLWIDGRKAFKYRLTADQLARRLQRRPRRLLEGVTRVVKKVLS
jgi:glutaredoxin